MMNGQGKSDRPEVPEKSPNNAGPPGAEGMEGRGLAKGNLPQQNASRTPSRSDAPSALERVRQAAKGDKKLRFTALLLSRRSQNGRIHWDRMRRLINRWLPPVR